MTPSVYDPDLIQVAVDKLNVVADDLGKVRLVVVQGMQTSAKWGFQPEPVAFKGEYGSDLGALDARVGKACGDVNALLDSLARIGRDVSDVDASSAVIAQQIAASRDDAGSTEQHY